MTEPTKSPLLDDATGETPPPAPSEKPTQKPARKKRRWLWLTALVLFVLLPASLVGWYAVTIYPTLPDASELKDVRYQVPLRILTHDGKLISEIGTQKRIPLSYDQIPQRMTQAIIAAEDENFFSHPGIDPKGLARAVYQLITTGHKKSGGSTITMQVARNFFLSRKKTFLRKLNEIVLSLKIEHQLSKPEILALYLNKIFLGHRSYGVAAAAQTYYGKDIHELTLDEYAMLAGLPKAPSAYNPITNPERAKLRRDYVLRRMHELGFISEAKMREAMAQPVHAKLSGARIEVEAGYVAEMARAWAEERYGQKALEMGLTIITSVDSRLQQAANEAVRRGLLDYERRHGYRGPAGHLAPAEMVDDEAVQKALEALPAPGHLKPAVVTEVTKKIARARLVDDTEIELPFDPALKWAAAFIDVNHKGPAPTSPFEVVKVGDLIYVEQRDDQWLLAQIPRVQGALISIDTHDGRVLALVGGFDYFASKFNRAVQGKRQIGSNIKPFLYSAALDKGYTAATIINDAPVVFHDKALEDVWRPENDSGRFYGPTRLRVALTHSRNLVSIRILQDIGIRYAIDYISRFGFPKEELLRHADLSLALGTPQFSPWQVVRGYSTFANGGYLIDPWFIETVQNFNGKPDYEAQPRTACSPEAPCLADDPLAAPRVISPQNAYIMTTIMQDVIRHGTGRRARVLNRSDIAGKTGTTNDQKDAWFSGFNPKVATTVWVGYDEPATLGRREFGSRAALPIWIDYMRVALADQPEQPFPKPTGLVEVPIDPKTGQAVPPGTAGTKMELFREAFAPKVPEKSQQEMEHTINELFQ
ncbi:penicillin-binding protein 1A [Sulfurivirga caldicuralii]|uniref:Penicillin-binding protein 1A n=1 Tax=Sulfurivirga caldicuralii TaxID=364032 RepID=A0A1N6DG29_9GAMM|nr:penicillin-binding protein 1A [Sulfurivirga caldicuralii]SIN69771.1 penicillin-binding protein 1A [Sulfurivirga caldicuralii]